MTATTNALQVGIDLEGSIILLFLGRFSEIKFGYKQGLNTGQTEF